MCVLSVETAECRHQTAPLYKDVLCRSVVRLCAPQRPSGKTCLRGAAAGCMVAMRWRAQPGEARSRRLVSAVAAAAAAAARVASAPVTGGFKGARTIRLCISQ